MIILNKLTFILLFVCWLFVHYYFANRTYLVLFLVAIITIIPLRDKNLSIVIVIAGVILFLLSPIVDTLKLLRDNAIYFVNDKEQILHDIFTSRAGLEVLPVEVQEELSLLEEYNLKDYQLFKTLENNPLLHQRIVEAAWPTRRNPHSRYLFALIEEAVELTPEWREISRKDHVVLLYRP